MSNRADNFLDTIGRFEQSQSVQDEDLRDNLDSVQAPPEIDYRLFASELDDLELEENITVTPVGFSNGVYYVSVNEETLGFNCSKEVAQKFEKLITFNTGAKALDWLKKNS